MSYYHSGCGRERYRAAPSYLCSNSMAWYPARGSRLSSSVIRKMYSECQKRGVQGVSKKAENKEWKSFLSGSMLGQRWQTKLRANKIHLQKGICTAVNVFGQSSDATRDLKRFCKWHRKNETRAVSCGVFLLFTVTYELLAVMLISHIGNKKL